MTLNYFAQSVFVVIDLSRDVVVQILFYQEYLKKKSTILQYLGGKESIQYYSGC